MACELIKDTVKSTPEKDLEVIFQYMYGGR